jgi:hypothetical protein
MHQGGIGKIREERVVQSLNQEESVWDFDSYVPIGNAVAKLTSWEQQGLEIIYLSSHESEIDVEKDKMVLEKFSFPVGQILYRRNEEKYKDIVERIVPDVLIEDDCESIGGADEMTITHVDPEIKKKIRSIVVKEFGGIDNLPDKL